MQISFLFVSRGGKEEYMYYDINESGKRLSELRKMRGLTQQQVADELGIDVEILCVRMNREEEDYP